MGHEFHPSRDMHSFACLVWECIARLTPWQNLSQQEIVNRVVSLNQRPATSESECIDSVQTNNFEAYKNGLGQCTNTEFARVIQVMHNCWMQESNHRPSAVDCLSHLEVSS